MITFNEPRPNNKQGWKQGWYILKNPQKYIGSMDSRGVPYRSSMEQRFIRILDEDKDTIRWTYEHQDTKIPYNHPFKKKICFYYPDFYFEKLHTKYGLMKFVAEVKPETETKIPVRANFRTEKAFNRQLAVNVIVEVKRRAALEFCKNKKWMYVFITEKFFEQLKK